MIILFRTARVPARLMIMSARGRARSGRIWAGGTPAVRAGLRPAPWRRVEICEGIV